MYYFHIIVLLLVVCHLSLFSCRNSNPNLSEKQLMELVSRSIPNQNITEDGQANLVMPVDTVSENADSKPRNTKYADADGKPIYKYVDEYGRHHTLDYPYVEVKPLFNEKVGEEEFRKYLNENNKFDEIAKENGIQAGRLFYEFIINTDGSVVDVTITNSTHTLFSAEMLRIINETQGKWTPGKHDGKTIKVRMVSLITY